MAGHVAYLNGEYLPYEECKLHVMDRGLRRGDVVFEAQRTFNGAVFRGRDHLERLYRSLKHVRIDPGMTIEEMEKITLEVAKRNEPLRQRGGEYYIINFVTRGLMGLPGMAPSDVTPTVCIHPIPAVDLGSYAGFYKSGAHAVIAKTRTTPDDVMAPRVKTYSRLHYVMAELEAADVDPEAFALLLDHQGNITESTTANFFIVTNGVLRTAPERSVLQGISRKVVLELADRLSIPKVEENIQPYDAYNANEAFLTATGPCILPLGRIDSRPVGKEAPGPITRQLLGAWSEMVSVDIVDQAVRQVAVMQR